MDPLADKIFVTATMLVAIEFRLMPAWIAIAVLCREFMVTGLRTLAAKKQVVISADRWGKLKTALQMAMLAIAGLAWVFEMDGAVEWLREKDFCGIRLWYIWMTYLCGIVMVTVLSGLGYFIRFRFLFLETPKKDTP
jgi:CDP-diacylglycerol--glycerol-3-phosphate 3-phosphatidyltransferase